MAYTFKPSWIPKVEDIELGARVCKTIKKIYFEQCHWIDCHQDVASMFTQVKMCARNVYSDKKETEVLRLLSLYDEFDIRTALEDEKIRNGTSMAAVNKSLQEIRKNGEDFNGENIPTTH